LLQRRASCDLTSWMNRAARIRCGSVCEVACASHAGGGIRSRSPGSRGVRLCERVKKRLRRLWVGCAEAFGEAVVDRLKQRLRLSGTLAYLLLPRDGRFQALDRSA